MKETTKANNRRQETEIFHRVFKGSGIDIGYGNDPLNKERWKEVEEIDLFDISDGDAQEITEFYEEGSYDFVYSSHCLEHVEDPFVTIMEWWKLVKEGGYMVLVVPDEDLYEQGHFPSKYNSDHKYTFTIYKKESWCKRSINVVDLIKYLTNCRVIKIELVDSGYNYEMEDRDQSKKGAEVGIEIIVQKEVAIKPEKKKRPEKEKRKRRYDIVWNGKLWDGRFEKKIKKYYKISFCTTCMDRLYNLKDTLPVNIEYNKSYPHLEFVILNYNSKDELDEWMKENMMEHIEYGLVSYYKTTEPEYFSMSHSRNIAFKVATGDIVNNVDADNYTYVPEGIYKCKPKENWASFLNRMANQSPDKIIFAKGKQLLRGRVGFYKKEFMELGGYDEDLMGYGHDDKDLITRAKHLDFVLYPWGGRYCGRIITTRAEKDKNMEKHWRVTEKENKEKSEANIAKGIFIANQNRHWGKAHLIKNFKEEMDI